MYDGIEASLSEKGYRIDVAVTKNRLNDEAVYLESMLKNNVSGLIIEGSRSHILNGICVCLKKLRSGIYRQSLYTIIMKICLLTV